MNMSKLKLKKLILSEQSTNDFLTLMKVKLKKIDPSDATFLDGDKIDDIDDTNVYLKYDSYTNFLEDIFDDSEGNVSSWMWAWHQPYRYDWYDCYNTKEDWDNGYIFPYAFTEEQVLKIKEIISYVRPELIKCFGENKSSITSDCVPKITEELEKLEDFRDLTEDLYCNAEDYAISSAMEKYTDELFDKIKKELPYTTSYYGTEEISIPIDNIIAMYSKRGETNLSIIDIIKKHYERDNVIDDFNSSPMETAWNIGKDEEAFRGEWDSRMDTILENLLEKIQEGEYDIDSISKSYEFINKKGGMDKNIDIPNTDYRISFKKILPDGDISYYISGNSKDGQWKSKHVSSSLENLENLFSNYQMFDIFD